MVDVTLRRDEALRVQRIEFPPGTWFTPRDNTRSENEGNEAVRTYGVEGR